MTKWLTRLNRHTHLPHMWRGKLTMFPGPTRISVTQSALDEYDRVFTNMRTLPLSDAALSEWFIKLHWLALVIHAYGKQA